MNMRSQRRPILDIKYIKAFKELYFVIITAFTCCSHIADIFNDTTDEVLCKAFKKWCDELGTSSKTLI